MNTGVSWTAIFLSLALMWVMLGTFPCRIAAVDSAMTLEAYLDAGLRRSDQEMDVSAFHATRAELIEAYRALLDREPLFFYVSRSLSYTYDREGYILKVYPAYAMSSEETAHAISELNAFADTVASLASPNFTEGDKALFIYQYLGGNFSYSPSGEENYDVYAMLTEGHGVCQAFSLAFILLGRRLGLQVDMVTSITMDHAWNHVMVDGRWYHADITRDLPTGDQPLTYHRFLLCDRAMAALGYTDGNCGVKHICEDHHYESPDDPIHTSALSTIEGGGLYISDHWLCLSADGALKTLHMDPNGPPCVNLSDTVDPNGDGRLTTADLLLPEVQQADESTYRITNRLRQSLLTETVNRLSSR